MALALALGFGGLPRQDGSWARNEREMSRSTGASPRLRLALDGRRGGHRGAGPGKCLEKTDGWLDT
jgi:hypothetical protein